MFRQSIYHQLEPLTFHHHTPIERFVAENKCLHNRHLVVVVVLFFFSSFSFLSICGCCQLCDFCLDIEWFGLCVSFSLSLSLVLINFYLSADKSILLKRTTPPIIHNTFVCSAAFFFCVQLVANSKHRDMHLLRLEL